MIINLKNTLHRIKEVTAVQKKRLGNADITWCFPPWNQNLIVFISQRLGISRRSICLRLIEMQSKGQSRSNSERIISDNPISGPACITCREKCRKCDRTKPICQRCKSKGLECKGYPEKFRFAGLATRGRWKSRAVPSDARNQAVQVNSRVGIEYDRSDRGHGDQTPHQLHNPKIPNIRRDEALPSSLGRHWHHSEDRSVELDDLLMLERTEVLLAHCTLCLSLSGCRKYWLIQVLIR